MQSLFSLKLKEFFFLDLDCLARPFSFPFRRLPSSDLLALQLFHGLPRRIKASASFSPLFLPPPELSLLVSLTLLCNKA